MSLVQGYTSSSDSGNEIDDIEKIPRVNVDSVVTTRLEADEISNDLPYNISNKKRIFAGTIEEKVYDKALFDLHSRSSVIFSKRQAKKLKKQRKNKGDPEDLDFLGPWAKYDGSSDEESKGTEYLKIENDFDKDRIDDAEVVENSSDNETTIPPKITSEFVGSSEFDYLGRSYMHIPKDLDINLTKESGSRENFVPKKIIYTFKGHSKGVNKLELLPNSGHLLLSCGNDSEIKLWDMYHQRELLRVFYGHSHVVKDVSFNSNGTEFLSCSFDKTINLWNTETGEIKKTIKVRAIPNVIKFNPNNENEFIVGLSNHNIEHYDLSIADYQNPIQVYDHHLGSINSLTIVEGKKRFMSTADDKSARFWDWQINIPIKVISSPSQHSIPSAAVYPGGTYIALQSMDNSVQVIQGHGKFKFNKKKRFTGHNVAGYGIEIDISPDGKILASGDSKGYAYFWDWKTGKMVNKIKVADKCISCIKFHPQETSKVIMAGISGNIFLCD